MPIQRPAPPCGRGGAVAATRLQALAAGRSIVCQEKDRDRFGRTVAICRASGEDLLAIMVREGFAWAFTRFSVDVSASRKMPASPTVECTRMTAHRRGSGGLSSAREACSSV